MILRSRVEERWRLFLGHYELGGCKGRRKEGKDLIVAISFLSGHQLPAAITLSPPGRTEDRRESGQPEEEGRKS